MAKAAQVLYPGQIDPGDPAKNPPDYTWRILAAGDSWFSFGSWRLQNLLAQLRFDKDTFIVQLAQPGDTITRMSDICKNPALAMQLDTRWGYDYHAVLLSGGGNDVIDQAAKIIPPSARKQAAGKPPEDYCDAKALKKTLKAVADGFAQVIDLRDGPKSPCKGVPLVSHAYDLATPRNAPAAFLSLQLGPWLFPAMTGAKIPKGEWNAVSDYVLGALAGQLIALESTLPTFHVARSQGTLKRADPDTTGVSNDWDNEIHPTKAGYVKIGKTINAVMNPLLP